MVLKFQHDRYGVKFTLDFGKITTVLGIFKAPSYPTEGISSICLDGKHVIFIDYDNIWRWIPETELPLLVDEFKLTPFYFFSTEERLNGGHPIGSYHAISLTKKHYHEVVDILRRSNCDRKFLEVPEHMWYHSWVLRVIPKAGRPAPQYLGVLGSRKWVKSVEVSRAHLEFLKKHYGVPDLGYKKLDNFDKVLVTTYLTAKR